MSCSLTLREAFEKHYDASELSRDSQRKFHHHLLVWERKTSNPPVCEIDNALIAEFRQKLIDHPYAASTINSGIWNSLRSILRKLATSEDAVSCDQLRAVICEYRGQRATRLSVRQMISGLRQWLRRTLCLDPADDPVPCVSRGRGGAWTVWIPSYVGMEQLERSA